MNIIGSQFPLRHCEGDIDYNQTVDVDDILALLNNWGACGSMTCTGDLNCNGVVEVDDLLHLINNWGLCEKGLPCPADIDSDEGDGIVNSDDLMEVIQHWSP